MAAPCILQTAGLSVRFGGLQAVDDVSLDLRTGSIHGVIGPNGAGKSTFFNAVSGFVAASAGRVLFDGLDITRHAPHTRSALGIQRTFQSVQLVRSMTVLENILVGLHPTTVLRPPGWGRSGGGNEGETAIERATAVAEQFGLQDVLAQEVGSLSFRDQRFTEVARATVSRPCLLMLDEPAGGLSPQEVGEFEQLLLRLRQEMGLTILLVEHVISLVMKVCEQVSVLDMGRLIATGTGAEIAADERVISAYLGGSVDA